MAQIILATSQRPATLSRATAPPPRKVSASVRQASSSNGKQGSKTIGTVVYMEPPSDGTKPYVYVCEPDDGKKQVNFSRFETEVTVYDMRGLRDEFTLKDNGIELHKLKVPDDLDWENEEEVKQRYYPLAEELLIKATGASRVHIFDHAFRRGHTKPISKEYSGKENGHRLPIGITHVDYTAASGVNRLSALLPDEAEKLQKTPFAVVQVWRPLKGPVRSSPLGVIDVSTVKKEDLVSYPLYFEHRTGYNYGVKYSPDHRWYYAEGINVDEAYVFLCYDSRKDRARFTPHTGFSDHSVGPDAPARESVELRSYCFFENEAPQALDKEL